MIYFYFTDLLPYTQKPLRSDFFFLSERSSKKLYFFIFTIYLYFFAYVRTAFSQSSALQVRRSFSPRYHNIRTSGKKETLLIDPNSSKDYN